LNRIRNLFNAEEAARLGLVSRIVPGASLLPEALAFAEVLAARPPLAVSAALAAIHRGLDASIDDGLAIEQAEFARIVPTNDAREGVAAFIEKRSPRFEGR
jgi:enoyl-CoA hydratase